MPSKPSALPARRTPAPSRPTRPRRSAPISTAEAASVRHARPPIPSPSSTSRRYRSQAMRSRRSSSASRLRLPSRPPHHVPQRLSRLHPPHPRPALRRALQQRLLLRHPRLHLKERRLRLAASFPCPGREPILLPHHRRQPSPPSLPLVRSLCVLQS